MKKNYSRLAELIIPSIFVKLNSIVLVWLARECEVMFPKKKAVNNECLYCMIVLSVNQKYYINVNTTIN